MLFEFNSIEAALEVFSDRSLRDTRPWRDACAYLIENAPPEVKEQLRARMDQHFPELKPDFVDEQGNQYYSPEKVQKVLGLSDEDMAKGLAEMQERHAERGFVSAPDAQLHRIQ